MAKPIPAHWTLACALGCTGLMGPVAGAQQAAPMRIAFELKNATAPAEWPVAVTQVSIGGRPIRLGQPVTLSGKWLGTTVVTLHNLSRKAIVQIGMNLVFPESGDGSNQNPYEAAWSTLGIVPKVVFTDRNGRYHEPTSFGAKPAPIRIPPGGTVHLSFAKFGDEIQAKVAQKGVPITKAYLQFTTIYFADDSRWSAGQYYLAPQTTGGAWTRATKDQFFSGARGAR